MKVRKRIKIVFNIIDDYILKDELEEVIKILESVEKIAPVIESKILLAYLSATNPWKNSVIKESRDKLIDSTEQILHKEVGKKRTNDILNNGLR